MLDVGKNTFVVVNHTNHARLDRLLAQRTVHGMLRIDSRVCQNMSPEEISLCKAVHRALDQSAGPGEMAFAPRCSRSYVEGTMCFERKFLLLPIFVIK